MEYKINNTPTEDNEKKCLHDSCNECGGTGKKKKGGMCIHYISCPCKKCSPFTL